MVGAVIAITWLGIHAQNAWGPLAFESGRRSDAELRPRRMALNQALKDDAEMRDLLRRDLRGVCEIEGASQLRPGTWSVGCTSGVLLVVTYDRDGALRHAFNTAELTASESPERDEERLRLFSELVPSKCSVVSARLVRARDRLRSWKAECRSGDRVVLNFSAQGIPTFINWTR
jgi:hypothetical protein